MDRILFILPPSIEYEDFVRPSGNVRAFRKQDGFYGSVLTDTPLGALALSAYVKKHTGAQTRLLDFNVVLNKSERFPYPSFKEFFRETLASRQWRDYEPGVICISALFMLAYQNILDLAECCREAFPGALILAGGGVATNMYRELFEDSRCLDGLCYGEGERPLTRLLQAADRRALLGRDPSWITREKAARGASFSYDFIDDLDEIPRYDYGLLDLKDYRLNPTIAAYPYTDHAGTYVTTMVSRGCPHRCCYCSAHTIHGREMRYNSVGRVREDLAYLKRAYGAGTIIFQDDHFMARPQRVYELVGVLKELGLTAFFPNALALYALDRKMLEALRGIGMRQLVMAIESGSERVLREVMHKPLSRSVIRRVARDCRELGIYMDANLIVGFPGETKRDIEDARAFLKTIDVNWFRIYAASPLVGSELFELCREKNYIKQDGYMKCNFKKAVIETGEFTAEYIQDMVYTMNLELNFVHNSDMRRGDYAAALKGFENALAARSDHALAFYYAGQCHEKLGDSGKAGNYLETARRLAGENPFWRRYADLFALPL